MPLRSALAVVLVVTLAALPVLARKKRRGYEGPNPCERLTPALLVDVLGAEKDAAFERHQGRMAKEVCSATWPRPNLAELEERQRRSVMEQMQARMKAQREGRPPPPIEVVRTHHEASLTFSRDLQPTKEEARRSFEAALATLERGVTGSAKVKLGGEEKEVTQTFQASHDVVTGVGDAAAWIPKLRQLGVLDGTGHFWVVVRVDEDDEKNRALAIALAKRLLSGKGGRP